MVDNFSFNVKNVSPYTVRTAAVKIEVTLGIKADGFKMVGRRAIANNSPPRVKTPSCHFK